MCARVHFLGSCRPMSEIICKKEQRPFHHASTARCELVVGIKINLSLKPGLF
jgi:hypothetical protein